MKIQKDGDGEYIGKAIEIPSMTVRSESRENLKGEITIPRIFTNWCHGTYG